MPENVRGKWARIVEDLRKTPGVWKVVATDADKSVVSRLRNLGAEVDHEATTPGFPDRRTISARWPNAKSRALYLENQLEDIATQLTTIETDLVHASNEVVQLQKLKARAAHRVRALNQEQSQLINKQSRLKAELQLNQEKNNVE